VQSTIEGMAKKSSGKTATIRVSGHLARMIDVIGTAEGSNSADICDPILEPVLVKRYEAALKKLADEGRSMKKILRSHDDEGEDGE
jgi:hypothetical protein